MKKRKLWFIGSAVASLALPIAAVSCGQESAKMPTKTFGNYAAQKIYRIQINSEYAQNRGEFDGSIYSGSFSNATDTASGALLFRHEATGKAEFEETNEVSSDGITKINKIQVLKPSILKWNLEYAKSIKLYVDGQEVVYDNDNVDPLGAPTEQGKYYKSSFVELTSNDPKSINNPKFFENLAKASRFEVEIDESSYWVNTKGEKTKYKVVAKDFYYGILRTYLYSDEKYRLANGGTADLDSKAKAITAKSDNMFKKDSTFGNKYLYGLYNINFDKIIDESQFIKSDGDKNYLVFQKQDETKAAQFVEFFKGILFGNYDYLPAPSQYIEEKNQDLASLRNYASSAKNQEAEAAASFATATGKTKESGLYWYGLTKDTALYAGRYYYAGYNADDLTKRWILNTHYKDQSYLNAEGRLKEIQEVHVNKQLTPDQFKNTNYEWFISGLTSTISYSQLDANTQNLIKNNKDVFGLSKYETLNKKSTSGHYYPAIVPNYHQNKQKYNEVYFNDAYAQLLWGNSYQDISEGKAKDTLTYTTSGRAAEFRNILSTAINWSHSARETYLPLPGIAWLTGVAQDTPIVQGDDVTPRKLADEINELFVVDRNTNQRVDLGGSLGTELRPSENNVVGQTAIQKYESAAFETLKARLKTLLDEFFASYTEPKDSSTQEIAKNDKIRFVISYRFVNYNIKNETAFLSQIKILNSLYPEKLEVSAVKLKDGDKALESLYSYYLNTPSPVQIFGWTSDYELINGSNDYRSWISAMPILAAIAYDEAYRAKVQVAYPTLVKAADKLKVFLEANKETIKLSIPIEKWSKLTSKDLRNLNDYLAHKVIDSEKTTDTNIVLKDIDTKTDKTEYISAGLLSAQYLLWLNTDSTHGLKKDELVKFTNELTNISGLLPNPFYTSLSESFSDRLVNPNYIFPSTPYADDYSSFLAKTTTTK